MLTPKVFMEGSANTQICDFGSCNDFSRQHYVQDLEDEEFEFIQLSAHSSPIRHRFDYIDSVEYLYFNTIYSICNRAIGYNLFCCSACNWDLSGAEGFLGASYLFNNNKCMFVVGSTKTGSMLGFSDFYTPLGNGSSVGAAMKLWWLNFCGASHSLSEIWWHYGMSILGDPMAMLKYQNDNDCPDSIMLNCFDNLNHSNVQYYRAKTNITVENAYIVPSGIKVILDAPQVCINPSFVCPIGASFEIRNKGCVINN